MTVGVVLTSWDHGFDADFEDRMTEYPELFEKIDSLEKEMDVQVRLIEGMHDRLAAVEDAVLGLTTTLGAMRRSRNGKKTGGPSIPSEPSGGVA